MGDSEIESAPKCDERIFRPKTRASAMRECEGMRAV